MTVEMRSRLARELSASGEPAIGDLAGAALREGRRQYRVGRLRQGATVLGAVAAVAAVAVAVPQLLAGPGPSGSITPAASGPTSTSPPVSPASASSAPASSSSASSSSTSSASASSASASSAPDASAPAASATAAPSPNPSAPPDLGPGIVPDSREASPDPARPVPATPAGLLLAVIDQLSAHGVDASRVDGAVVADGSLFVQVSLTTGTGPGMFRLSVSDSAPGTVEAQPGETLVRRGDGTVVVTGGIADNCIQHRYAYAYRPDGTMVYVGVANCLAWNGRTNPAARPPLTLDQAVALATDPAIGRTVPADVEAAGEAKFAHVPTFH